MMIELRLGDQLIEYDQELTIAAYRDILVGGADECGCDDCRNFAAQRGSVYPEQFLALLDQLGIDARKEGEVYECDKNASDMHLYGGWFYFVGRLVVPGEYLVEAGPFSYHFATSFPQPPEPFAGRPVLTVEFYTRLPWLLK